MGVCERGRWGGGGVLLIVPCHASRRRGLGYLHEFREEDEAAAGEGGRLLHGHLQQALGKGGLALQAHISLHGLEQQGQEHGRLGRPCCLPRQHHAVQCSAPHIAISLRLAVSHTPGVMSTHLCTVCTAVELECISAWMSSTGTEAFLNLPQGFSHMMKTALGGKACTPECI